MSLVRRPVLSAARLGATGLRIHLSTSPVHHLRVAAVQLRERPTVSATVARISDLLGEAARNDAQVALFPEAALTGYGPEAVERTSAEDVIAAEKDVRAACRRYSIGAIVGTPRDGFNSALVIGADGSELCRQHKMQLVPTDLPWTRSAGEALHVFVPVEAAPSRGEQGGEGLHGG